MAKKKRWEEPKEDKEVAEVSFVDEDLEEFGELVVSVEEEAEEVSEPEPKSKKNQNKSKVVVTSTRAWVFAEADVHSRGLTGVARGNLLNVLSSDAPEGWFHVQVRKVSGPVDGFIQAVRVREV